MKFRKSYLLLTYLFCLSAFAESGDSGDRGNGGDVLICDDGVVTLLDHYEALDKGRTINLLGNTISEKVQTFIDRFRKVDPIRGAKLVVYADEILEDFQNIELSKNQILKNITTTDQVLEDIDDSIHLSIPVNCKKEQLVIQQRKFSEVSKFTTRYVFNRQLLQKLFEMPSLEYVAMVVIHESLFRLHLDEGATDSRFTRAMNGLISSSLNFGLNDYLNLISNSVDAGYIDVENKVYKKEMKLSSYTLNYPEFFSNKDKVFYSNKLWNDKSPSYNKSLAGKRWLVNEYNEVEFLYINYSLYTLDLYYDYDDVMNRSSGWSYMKMSSEGKLIVAIYSNKISIKLNYLNGLLVLKKNAIVYKMMNGEFLKVCSDQIKSLEFNGRNVLKNQAGCVEIKDNIIVKISENDNTIIPDFEKFKK